MFKDFILDGKKISMSGDLPQISGDGWFSNNIEEFDNLNNCWYNSLWNIDRNCSYSRCFVDSYGEGWQYFLPLKSLLKELELYHELEKRLIIELKDLEAKRKNV